MFNYALPLGYVLKSKLYNYRIEKILGQGSFGITYLAKIELQGDLGYLESCIHVTIKEFFMKEISGREGTNVTSSSNSKGGLFYDYKEKFAREAKNLSKLKHPNIVNVMELFEANNTCYYVMEYLSGGDLDSLIEHRGKLTEEDTLKYTRQIGEALSFMHQNKMLHLDLKPKNVMLNAAGDAILIDFGLSKQYDSSGEPESSTTVGRGTPGYAPLEQANYQDGHGFPVTMDIYALGATMYKMLTGKRSPEASVILNEGFPMACLLKHNVSDAMASIIKKAMMPRKDERFQSVFELRNELENLNVYQDEESEETHIDENNLFEEPKDNVEKEEEINVSKKEESEETYVEEHLVIDETIDKIVIQYKSEIRFEITPNMLRLNHSCPNIIGIENFKSFVKALSQIQLIKRQEAPYNINVDMNIEKVSISLYKRGIIDRVYSVQTYEGRSYGTLYGNAQSVWLQFMHFITGCLPLNSKFHTYKWYNYPPHINNFILKEVSQSKLPVQKEETIVCKVLDFFDDFIFDIKWKIKYNWKSFIFLILIVALFIRVYKSPLFPSGRINGHSYVDLGLSVKWATTDVGSWWFCKPGSYFKWGNLSPVHFDTYSVAEPRLNYRLNIVDFIEGDTTEFVNTNDVDSIDAAHYLWGESWRMPTYSEIKELQAKCKWKWISLGTGEGYLVTGPNGKQIFLPMSSYNSGIWSSTLNAKNAKAYLLEFSNNKMRIQTEHQWYFWHIRPVTK